MRPVVAARGWRWPVAALVTIDESTAMALAHADPREPRAGRTAFWATGIAVYVGWNLATLAGALGAASLGDPGRWGLDAMVPAAFLALLWPRLTSRSTITVALAAAALAVVTTPLLPPGLPVLLGAVVAGVAAFWGPATKKTDDPGVPVTSTGSPGVPTDERTRRRGDVATGVGAEGARARGSAGVGVRRADGAGGGPTAGRSH